MKPILFNTEMVRAILDGRKTVTRRVVKFRDGKNPNWTGYVKDGLTLYNGNNEPCNMPVPFKVNDILYVRETWSDHYEPNDDGKPELKYCYKADGIDLKAECLPGENNRWYPSIHMPKAAARIFLKVTGVRVERLQEMRSQDALCEGITVYHDDLPHMGVISQFSRLWDSTIKKDQLQYYGWDANPYVWVIEFEAIDKAVAMANDTEEKRK